MQQLRVAANDGKNPWVPWQSLPLQEIILFAYAADRTTRPTWNLKAHMWYQLSPFTGVSTTLWLMATGRATREALLSEAGFEKVFRTQNWVRRSKLFCR